MATCVKCGHSLSRYSLGSECGACAWATRAQIGEPPPIDDSFWEESRIRRAARDRDLQTLIRAYLDATGLTQEAIALLISSDQGTISKIVRGQRKRFTIEDLEGIRDGLRIPGRLFGLLPGPHEAGTRQTKPTKSTAPSPRRLDGVAPCGPDHLTRDAAKSGDTVAPVERRIFGKTMVAITLAIPLADTEPGQPIDVTRLTPHDVVADLYELDDRYGGAAIGDVAHRRLTRLTRQLGRTSLSPDIETKVQSMIGTLSTCCAWLAFDSGDHKRARRLDADALCAAHLANDRALQVEVLASMSMQARRNDKPGEAINLAESALSIGGSDPRIRALLSMRIASASAKRQDPAAFNSARQRAWNHMEHASDVDHPGTWYRFVDEHELSGLEGMALMALDRNAEAADLLREATSNRAFLRNGAYYSAVRARALVAAGAPDEAASVVNATLPTFTELTSGRVFDELAKVRRGLEPYMSDGDIAECAEAIDDFVGA